MNNYEPAYFGSGTKLTVLGKKVLYIFKKKKKKCPGVNVCLLTVLNCKSEKDEVKFSAVKKQMSLFGDFLVLVCLQIRQSVKL